MTIRKVVNTIARLPKAWRVGRAFLKAQEAISGDNPQDGLLFARKLISISRDRSFEARILEALALYHSGRVSESGAPFARAIELIALDKTLTEYVREYLVVYCCAHFKRHPVPDELIKVRIPALPQFSKVSKKFPFTVCVFPSNSDREHGS